MMAIEELKKLVEGCERYLQVANSHGDDITINSIPKCDIGVATVRFEGHQGETWEKELWIDIKGALHIESPETRESIFDFAAELGWKEDEVHYIIFGRDKNPAFWILDIQQVAENIPNCLYKDNLQAIKELMNLLDEISERPMLDWTDYVDMYNDNFDTYISWEELLSSEEDHNGLSEEECRKEIGKTIWRLPCGWFVRKL